MPAVSQCTPHITQQASRRSQSFEPRTTCTRWTLSWISCRTQCTIKNRAYSVVEYWHQLPAWQHSTGRVTRLLICKHRSPTTPPSAQHLVRHILLPSCHTQTTALLPSHRPRTKHRRHRRLVRTTHLLFRGLMAFLFLLHTPRFPRLARFLIPTPT